MNKKSTIIIIIPFGRYKGVPVKRICTIDLSYWELIIQPFYRGSYTKRYPEFAKITSAIWKAYEDSKWWLTGECLKGAIDVPSSAFTETWRSFLDPITLDVITFPEEYLE